ncbi:MAG: MFS transporter [Bacteroidota bacterium]
MKSLTRLYYESFRGLSRSIWMLSMVTLINRTGAMVLPFLSVYLTQVLDFSKGQTGVIITMFGLGSLVGTRIGGYLTDKIGYYQVQFWSLVLGGMLFILLDFVHGFWPLVIYIFVLSIIAESYRPAVMVAISAYSTSSNLTRSFGLLRFAINLGFSAGPALGGLLAARLGYRWLFWVDGITCITAGLVFRLTLKERAVSRKEEVDASATLPAKQVTIFKDKKYLLFLVTSVVSSIVFVQFISVIPVYFKEEILLSEATIGLLLASNGLMIAFFEMPLVYKFEGRISLLKMVLIGYALIGLCYVCLLGLPKGLLMATIAIIMITFGEMLCFPFGNTYALQQTNSYNKGKYMAFYAMSFSLAHVIAPTLGFQIAGNYGYPALWTFLIILAGLSCWGIIILQKQHQKLASAIV